jgi:phosphoribosylaminoimidazole (AIR) synthetase
VLTDKLSDEELATKKLPSGALLGESLLAPTRIYTARLLAALAAGLPIHAAAHITGGGITENLNRVLPPGLDALIDWGSWEVPEVIELVCEAADLSLEEALKTFNMGIGMALVVDHCKADAVLDYFDGLLPVWRIGEIVVAESGAHRDPVEASSAGINPAEASPAETRPAQANPAESSPTEASLAPRVLYRELPR